MGPDIPAQRATTAMTQFPTAKEILETLSKLHVSEFQEFLPTLLLFLTYQCDNFKAGRIKRSLINYVPYVPYVPPCPLTSCVPVPPCPRAKFHPVPPCPLASRVPVPPCPRVPVPSFILCPRALQNPVSPCPCVPVPNFSLCARAL